MIKEKADATIGFEYWVMKYRFGDDRVQVDVWDTAGQDKFKSLIPSYYKRASGAVVVYDITNLDSYHSIQWWMNEIENNSDPDIL